MSSRGKRKKPLGNEGKSPLDEEDPVVLNIGEADESETPNDGYFYTYHTGHPVMQLHPVDFSHTSIMTTYWLVEEVLQERARSLPVALAKNTFRHGIQDRWKDWTAAGIAGLLAGANLDPILGIVIAATGAMARNVIEVFRLRRGRHKEVAPGKSKAGAEIRMMITDAFGELPTKIDLRGKLPDLPEFNNEWVRLAHRLIRLAQGYNVRADVVNRIRLELARDNIPGEKAAMLESVADGMAKMLLEVRPRLVNIGQILEELHPIDFKDLRLLEEHDDRLLTNDLLGEESGGAASLLWLDAPGERILIPEAPLVHENDLGVRAGRIAIDEDSLEQRFVRLEEELIREREHLESGLAILVSQIESLPPEERPAAEERLESIRDRLREIIASLDVTIDIDVDEPG